MKVVVKRINKYHDLQGFLVDFASSDVDRVDLNVYSDEYKNDWSMYMSLRIAVNRSNLNVKIHTNAGEIYIEKD